ncbi:MAG: hypothetical protein AB1792_11945 [Candidatus Zixiibacteriota bacterium]
MKRYLPILLVLLSGAFLVFQYFVPHETSEFVYEYALDWAPIIGIFAMTLGLVSLARVSWSRVRKREANWPYALVTLAGLASILVAGLWPGGGGLQAPVVAWEYSYLMLPLSSTMYALLAFFIASATYRAFRVRSVLATLLLLAAVIVMLRFFPLGPLTGPIGGMADWILYVPNLAAKRAILIGVGLGVVATAMKIVLGIERSYLGRD